jgi:EAL domain-containing protein (putative c-di-GMP-specific phosphodiesterase class I)/GGDEF domain-containing protein
VTEADVLGQPAQTGSLRGPQYFELRAEWLRYRSHLIDPATELPTLAAALDDIRRLLEERSILGLVFLDLSETRRLEPQQGFLAYDELVRSVGAALRALRGGVLGPRDLVSMLGVRCDKFLVVTEGVPGEPLGTVALGRLADAVRTNLLEEGSGIHLPGMAPLMVHVGQALLRRDPTLRPERSVQRALDEAIRSCFADWTRAEGRSTQGLDQILETDQLTTFYQPILALDDLSVLGHEVFTHGPVGGPFESPERLFLLAERTGRLVKLERLCRKRALSCMAPQMQTGARLFLNTTAHALRDPELAGGAFLEALAGVGVGADKLVLELAERATVEERRTYLETLQRLKGRGVGVAIDDMGAGYSSLQAVVELEPDYLKFDIALVRDIDRSRIKRSLLETVVELSAKIGAEVIAEGIESESELHTVRSLGVELGQGRYLAPPVAVSDEASR